MPSNEQYMLRCLGLAQKGAGHVSPNPLVGAVLVWEDTIIGEGWHQQYGQAHAEVNCLRSVKEENRHLVPSGRLYVSLEPCAHFGKTPPCTQLILRHRIPEVIIGCPDTYKEVSGKGIRQLTEAGVHVRTGILEKDCRRINKRFFTRQEKQRPYIILKWAESADGFMAPETGGRMQLSGATSQKLVHRMRHEEDAVLVGYQTALTDNPELSNRYWTGRQPLRVVLDPEHMLPEELRLFGGEQPTLIFNFHRSATAGKNRWIKIERDQNIAQQIVDHLPDINSLIVEGGAKTLRLFTESDLWDEAVVFRTPVVLGKGREAPLLRNSRHMHGFQLAEDRVGLFIHEQNSFYI